MDKRSPSKVPLLAAEPPSVGDDAESIELSRSGYLRQLALARDAGLVMGDARHRTTSMTLHQKAAKMESFDFGPYDSEVRRPICARMRARMPRRSAIASAAAVPRVSRRGGRVLDRVAHARVLARRVAR